MLYHIWTLWTLTKLYLQLFIVVQNSSYYVGRKKIVQCLICEQKNAQLLSFSSFFFVFFIRTEINTVHVLFQVHGNCTCTRSSSLNMSKGNQWWFFSVLLFILYSTFILKVSRVDFFLFLLKVFCWNAGWRVIGFWEKLCSCDSKNTYLNVLSFDKITAYCFFLTCNLRTN